MTVRRSCCALALVVLGSATAGAAAGWHVFGRRAAAFPVELSADAPGGVRALAMRVTSSPRRPFRGYWQVACAAGRHASTLAPFAGRTPAAEQMRLPRGCEGYRVTAYARLVARGTVTVELLDR